MILKTNQLDVDTYLKLREKVNWKKLTKTQAEAAIKGSLYTVVAYEDNEPVGMGRIVGDGAVICYIQDLIVVPECQKKGTWHAIITKLIDYVKEIKLSDTEIMLDLMCARGRENFYKKEGFISRPNDKLGPGMIMYIK